MFNNLTMLIENTLQELVFEQGINHMPRFMGTD
jgi:hypothetical protein